MWLQISTPAIERVGDVLYVGSGTTSQVNMYNISNNMEFIDIFVVFEEGFFIEELTYDPVHNKMYMCCDDYPYVLEVKSKTSNR